MRAPTKALGVIAMVAWLALNLVGAEDKKVQVALTGSFLVGDSVAGTGGILGFGMRAVLELKGPFTVSPEIDMYQHWRSIVPACTLNLRFGKGYIGLGPMVALCVPGGYVIGLVKAHAGIKSRHWLIEADYIAGGASRRGGEERTTLIGLTFGVVF